MQQTDKQQSAVVEALIAELSDPWFNSSSDQPRGAIPHWCSDLLHRASTTIRALANIAPDPVDGLPHITQDEVDALWLACRVEVAVGDVPRDLKRRAQLRIQRLADAGAIDHAIGKHPTIKETPHVG